ncbi:MAG: hypothetical protein JWL88_313 [Parcubacteria group bacterium]|nr:hypothetical protein [Parcubacteria group bacterium]
MRTPVEFDEAMIEPPKPEKAPKPGSDEYYEALGKAIDERPIGVPHRKRPPAGPLD